MQFGDLIGRMVISLVVVLGIVLIAYKVIKRRQNRGFLSGNRSGGLLARMATPSRSMGAAGGRGANTKRGLRLVGRVGLSRTSAVVAVQFGERVFMVGASEQGQPTMLAETDLETWTAATETADEIVPPARRIVSAANTRPRSSLLEALREVTARRG